MTSPEDYAFPVTGSDSPYWQPGMTLRDWFAGHVIMGYHVNSVTKRPEQLAREAYAIADAMLAEREALHASVKSPSDEQALTDIARSFIDKHGVSCPEATINDSVYEDAPLLVEHLAEIVGYHKEQDA